MEFAYQNISELFKKSFILSNNLQFRMKQGITDVIIWLLIAGTSSIIFWLLITALGSEIKPSTDSPHIIPSPKTPAIRSDVCTTKGCTRAANVFINSIDPTVDPCEDFYDFSCGGYVKNHYLPIDVYSREANNEVKLSFVDQMIDYLSHDSLESKPNIADRRAAKLFRLCLDIDKQGIQPFIPLIKEVGGPPFSGGVRPGWEKMIEVLGIEHFPLWRRQFMDNEMSIVPPWLRSLENDKSMPFIAELAKMITYDMGMNWDGTSVQSQITGYLNLLTTLEEVIKSNMEMTNPDDTGNVFNFTLEQAIETFPEIPWKALMKTSEKLPAYFRGYLNYTHELYNLWQIGTLNNLMKDWYLLKFLEYHLMEFGVEYTKLYEDRSGYQRDMVSYCIHLIEFTMPRWVDVFFWENVAKPQDYVEINNLTANIKEAWLENMRENDWIEPETKRNITDRVAKISFKYVFQVPLYTRKELDDLYAQYVHIDSPSFFEYTQAAETFVVKGTFPDYSWKHALTQFAYYHPSIETPYVFLSTRIILEPYFASDYPPELNYGSIGFIAAHEVTHGFDPNVLNRSLLVGDDEQQFDERVECIVDQFGNITVPTQSPGSVDHYNGSYVRGETTSDTTGIRASFRAYRKERARLYGDHPAKLPGLEEYSGDQLFFIASAQFFCAKENGRVRMINPKAEHPMDKHRVNEGVKNFEAFGDAFSCKPNSPMNPQKKCRIWRHRHRRQ